VVREGGAQRFDVAHERTSGLERRVEPLVRIDRHRIRLAQPAQVIGRLGDCSSKTTIGAVDVKPRTVLSARRGDLVQRIDSASAHGASGADDNARHIAGGSVRLELSSERRNIHAELRVGRNPADRRDAEPAQVRSLLNPGMCFDRPIYAESAARITGDTLLAHVPACLCQTRSQETDEIGHVAAADEEPAAIRRIADQLRDPPYGLRFDFRRGRRQDEGPDVRVDGGSEKVAENPDRRRRRGDVPEEARVRVEERMIEQKSGGLLQQRTRFRSLFRKRTRQAECGANGRWRLASRDWIARHRGK
jgi:hypothetical protein